MRVLKIKRWLRHFLISLIPVVFTGVLLLWPFRPPGIPEGSPELPVPPEREVQVRPQPSAENRIQDSVGPVYLGIPAIALHTPLGFAPVVNGRIDAAELKKKPVIITPAASPSLRPPGETGVCLILGHRQWNNRPLIFARLDELEAGDVITLGPDGSGHSYVVYGKKEVKPETVWDVVDQEFRNAWQNKESRLMLSTCAPYGFNHRRLLILARKVGKRVEAEGRRGDPGP